MEKHISKNAIKAARLVVFKILDVRNITSEGVVRV